MSPPGTVKLLPPELVVELALSLELPSSYLQSWLLPPELVAESVTLRVDLEGRAATWSCKAVISRVVVVESSRTANLLTPELIGGLGRSCQAVTSRVMVVELVLDGKPASSRVDW